MDTATLINRMVHAYNRRDLDALRACYAPGASVHQAGWPAPVDTDTWLGFFEAVLATFPDLRIHPRNLAAQDRAALLEARLTGTNTGRSR